MRHLPRDYALASLTVLSLCASACDDAGDAAGGQGRETADSGVQGGATPQRRPPSPSSSTPT